MKYVSLFVMAVVLFLATIILFGITATEKVSSSCAGTCNTGGDQNIQAIVLEGGGCTYMCPPHGAAVALSAIGVALNFCAIVSFFLMRTTKPKIVSLFGFGAGLFLLIGGALYLANADNHNDVTIALCAVYSAAPGGKCHSSIYEAAGALLLVSFAVMTLQGVLFAKHKHEGEKEHPKKKVEEPSKDDARYQKQPQTSNE